MTEIERCVRCADQGPARGFSYWVLVGDETGDRLAGVCDSCLTAVERREIEQEALAPLEDDLPWIDGDAPVPSRPGHDPDALSSDTGQWLTWDLRTVPAMSPDAAGDRRADRR
jgi:hypothetical protein